MTKGSKRNVVKPRTSVDRTRVRVRLEEGRARVTTPRGSFAMGRRDGDEESACPVEHLAGAVGG